MDDEFDTEERQSDVCSWPGEAGARRLFESVREACAAREDLPASLEAGLRTALEILAADPELAYLLTVETGSSEGGDGIAARREWSSRFGALLHAAAVGDPRTTIGRRFLADFLVDGVRFQIACVILEGEESDLLRLLPGTLEALLAYFIEPGESVGM